MKKLAKLYVLVGGLAKEKELLEKLDPILERLGVDVEDKPNASSVYSLGKDIDSDIIAKLGDNKISDRPIGSYQYSTGSFSVHVKPNTLVTTGDTEYSLTNDEIKDLFKEIHESIFELYNIDGEWVDDLGEIKEIMDDHMIIIETDKFITAVYTYIKTNENKVISKVSVMEHPGYSIYKI